MNERDVKLGAARRKEALATDALFQILEEAMVADRVKKGWPLWVAQLDVDLI